MDLVPPAVSRSQPASLLPRSVVLLVGAAATVIAAAGIRAGSGVIAPLALAVLLTVALMPVGRWARDKGWPGWAATALTLSAIYALVLSLAAALAISLAQLARVLPTYAPRASEVRDDIVDQLAGIGVARNSASTALDRLDLTAVIDLITGLLSSLVSVTGSLFFLLTLLFFTTTDAVAIGTGISRLAASRPEMARSLGAFAVAIRRYLIVSAIFGGIVAVLDAGALWLLGIPLPLLWGLLAFVTNFIPNIGFVIGVIPPALLALLDQGWAMMLAVIAIYSALNVVIQTLIQPRYVGDAVGLRPTVTFVSLAVWASLLGPLGALLAVPMTLFMRAVLVDPDRAAVWGSMLIGSTAASSLTPPVGPQEPQQQSRDPSPPAKGVARHAASDKA